MNFNFIFISLLCSVLELNHRNQGYRIRAGIQDAALSSSHIVSLSSVLLDAAGSGELPARALARGGHMMAAPGSAPYV